MRSCRAALLFSLVGCCRGTHDDVQTKVKLHQKGMENVQASPVLAVQDEGTMTEDVHEQMWGVRLMSLVETTSNVTTRAISAPNVLAAGIIVLGLLVVALLAHCLHLGIMLDNSEDVPQVSDKPMGQGKSQQPVGASTDEPKPVGASTDETIENVSLLFSGVGQVSASENPPTPVSPGKNSDPLYFAKEQRSTDFVKLTEATDSEVLFFELWDKGMERNNGETRGFPYSLGPFKLKQPAKIQASEIELIPATKTGYGAWTLNITNAHSGLKNLRSKETNQPTKRISGHLSPFQEVTIGPAMRQTLGIPSTATNFAFSYPAEVAQDKGNGAEGGGEGRQAFDTDLAFVSNGGFVYCDMDGNCVAVLALQQDPLGYIVFGPPRRWKPHWATTAAPRGFNPVTLAPLVEAGASHFRWVLTNELEDEKMCSKGGFAYIIRDGELPDDCA